MNWKSKLGTEKIYILPTRAGLLFIVATLVILLIGSGYSNNLVNILAFFMLSLVFVTMILTHLQLKDLDVESVDLEHTFAGSPLLCSAVLKNKIETPRFGIDLEFATIGPSRTDYVTLRPKEPTRAVFHQVAPARGRYSLDKILLSSVYPMGFFYSWKLLPVKKDFLVYPQPRGETELPRAASSILDQVENEIQNETIERNKGDDFRGHRNFVRGDSSRHIDWRAHARGRPLLIKELNEGGEPHLFLEWTSLNHLDTEARLSQLTLWIVEAQKLNLGFRLRVPGFEGTDPELCLAALAQFAAADSSDSKKGRA